MVFLWIIMFSRNYLIVYFISSLYMNIARCSLIVEIKMVSFTSDGRLDHSGIRCDSGSCDNYFKLCVLNSDIAENCMKTDIVYRNKDSFTFPTELPSHNTSLPPITNPFEIHISEWPTKDIDKVITLEVHDWDRKEDDLLYRNSTNISNIPPFGSDSEEPQVRILQNSNGKTSTKINVRLYCEVGFTGPGCSQRDTVCHPNTCLNKGKCIETGEQVKCHCTGGFSGDRCETRLDPCKLGNCKHGNCTPGFNSYTCQCFQGYRGDDCDQDVDECQSSPCQNGGICINLEPGFRCQCPSGKAGDLCALEADECAINPCLNNGRCTRGIDDFTCECVAGFEGELCEIRVNTCDSSPCINSGICIDLINNFKCICQEGFDGPFCENNIDKCSSTPCRNDASCFENNDGYICNCARGFTGVNCELNIDECSSQPCFNGGRCVDHVDGYACDCPSGFEGSNCYTNSDDCADPTTACLNGGTCVDGLDAFTCRCQDPFIGNRCEVDSSESGIEMSVKDQHTLDLTDLETRFSDLIKEHVPGTEDVVIQTFVPSNQNQQDDITQVVFVIFINNTMIAGNDANQLINAIPEGERAKLIRSNTVSHEDADDNIGNNDLKSSNGNLLEGMILGIIVFQAAIILLILVRWRRSKRYASVERQEETTDETSPV